MKDKISVIIPTYCTHDRGGLLRLKLALIGYLKQTLPSKYYEIKLIDDGSECDIESFLKEMKLNLPIEIYRIPHSGMCSAYNFGIEHSHGNYVFLGIDDSIPSPELLERHFVNLTKNKSEKLVVIGKEYTVSPAEVDNVESDKLTYKKIFNKSFLKRRYIDIEKVLTSFNSQIINLIWLAMRVGNHSLKRELIADIHGFDTTFDPTGWYADIEFGYRLKKTGATFRFIESAQSIHLQHNLLSATLESEEKNLNYFYRKHKNIDVMLLPVFFDFGKDLGILDYEEFIKKIKRVTHDG